MPKILIFDTKQEISSFNPMQSGFENFQILRGDEIFAHRGLNTEFGGALKVFEGRADVTVIPTILAQAGSAGILSAEGWARLSQTVLDAVKEAGDAVASLQSLTRQQALQDEAVASAEKAYRFAQERYRAGLGNYLVVLSTESQVLAQRRLAVDLRARQLDTRLVLMKALGGGWEDDTAVLHTAAK